MAPFPPLMLNQTVTERVLFVCMRLIGTDSISSFYKQLSIMHARFEGEEECSTWPESQISLQGQQLHGC